MNVTAIVADDEENLSIFLVDMLKKVWPQLQIVGVANNGEQAEQMIQQLKPNIAFLDIKMPGLTGIEVAQGIQTDTQVVFVTAYDEFAVQAFEREAIDYLVKPVNEARLTKAVERVKRSLGKSSADAGAQNSPAELAKLLTLLANQAAAGTGVGPLKYLRWIRASRGATTFQIPIQEVLFFKSDDKYTIVQTEQGEHIIRTPLIELLRELDLQEFWQIHRGTVVNASFVQTTTRDELGNVNVQVKGHKTALTVSRTYQYLFKQM
jgi:DNA-binding LytR/AlgR family response regulator